jgi:uncharacterized protein YciI
MSLPPIHRQVVVPVGPAEAFEAFTDRIGSWWPVDRFSVHGPSATAAFRDGLLVETGPDGAEAIWGKVLDWQPPRSFRMTWHPGRDAATASTVEVTFAPVADTATLVTVTHSGWETLEARTEYQNGWPVVMSSLAASIAGSAAEPGHVILVLNHSAAPGVGNPFEHPLFREHARFLSSLHDRGVLVGAGPFPASGEGMTIVRAGDAAAAAGIVRAAQDEDGSVTGGVLEVRCRPWVVMMHGSSLA